MFSNAFVCQEDLQLIPHARYPYHLQGLAVILHSHQTLFVLLAVKNISGKEKNRPRMLLTPTNLRIFAYIRASLCRVHQKSIMPERECMHFYYVGDLTWTCGILEGGSIDLYAAKSPGLRRMFLSCPAAIENTHESVRQMKMCQEWPSTHWFQIMRTHAADKKGNEVQDLGNQRASGRHARCKCLLQHLHMLMLKKSNTEIFMRSRSS